MPLSLATVIFLLVALAVAIGIVAAVALPHLRGGGRAEDSEESGDRRHTSRTRRD